ncbi:MAG: 23S rRNA (pseudouridine(1915)-N(3))-methyltransferase RlmH [Chlamydiia bacterium]|nr:23S rRNA (pseudouridine(1915)-N(3))-methyltransferase RlmH [Chlamydiia bacterium]
MGLKIKIFSPGKTKETWLQTALLEYEKRLKGTFEITWDFNRLPEKGPFICLDPGGMSLSSVEFSTFLYHALEEEGSRLTFVIGGPEGIPQDILQQASQILSFSKMTFTHQHIRLLLLEQIYRGMQIRNKAPYHK